MADDENVWERAKLPDMRRYCDLLAGAAAKLAAGSAREVIPLTEEAERLGSGRATPLVLRARAWLRLGRVSDALRDFEAAQKVDAQAVDEPAALHAWARVLARVQRTDESRRAYRALLTRTASLPATERVAAHLEAGFVFMHLGKDSLDEAAVAFRQARREGDEVLSTVALVALALSSDRAGKREQAKVAWAELANVDARAALSSTKARDVLAHVGQAEELHALLATALETKDPKGATAAWQKYMDAATSPWLEHARAKAQGKGRR